MRSEQKELLFQIEENELMRGRINNPRSGTVMKRIGMKYCYSYKEQW